MRRISRAEPVTDLRRVKIHECGEPLADFLADCPELRLDRPRFHYRRETLLRKSVAERLCRANSRLLVKGLRIHVIEGWRAPFIQERMYRAIWERFRRQNPDWSEHRLKRVVNRYSAPNDPRVPPPHTTGGAADLVLYTRDGRPVDIHRPYDQYDPASFAFDAPGLSEEARRNRQTMVEALAVEGITNYPSEYWHYSYGDQGWAYRGDHEFAIYGAAVPPDWQPNPGDLREEPLRYIDESSA